MATSIPTSTKIPPAITAINLFLSNPKQDLKVAGSWVGFDSSIFVKKSQSVAAREVMAYTAKTSFQLPVCTAIIVVITGPSRELEAFINWERLM